MAPDDWGLRAWADLPKWREPEADVVILDPVPWIPADRTGGVVFDSSAEGARRRRQWWLQRKALRGWS